MNRTSVTISLDIVNPTGNVDSYVLHLKNHQKQFSIPHTSVVQRYTVLSLLSAEEYTLYVIAVSNSYKSSPSSFVTISTGMTFCYTVYANCITGILFTFKSLKPFDLENISMITIFITDDNINNSVTHIIVLTWYRLKMVACKWKF